MALMHFYVVEKTEVTDVNMNVVYGFPLNVYIAKADATTAKKHLGNDGINALSVGLKVYITKDKTPLHDYYGFYVPRMTPFYKSTGGNEIDVVESDETRSTRCWCWGSYNGAGYALKLAHAGSTYLTGLKYIPLVEYADINMVICKLDKSKKADATNGAVIVIPAT
jgi:hypothetical protein